MKDKLTHVLLLIADVLGVFYLTVFFFFMFHQGFIGELFPACHRAFNRIYYVQCGADTASRLIEYGFLYFTPYVFQLFLEAVNILKNAGEASPQFLKLAVGELVVFGLILVGALRMFGLTLHGLFEERGLDGRPFLKAVIRACIIIGPSLAVGIYRLIF